jgi:hypothetical protein
MNNKAKVSKVAKKQSEQFEYNSLGSNNDKAEEDDEVPPSNNKSLLQTFKQSKLGENQKQQQVAKPNL